MKTYAVYGLNIRGGWNFVGTFALDFRTGWLLPSDEEVKKASQGIS